ncbi:MAG: caspase family protein, partial [Bacteroidales bacterium]|nr:caspase family protein [Bacteroidales bacterium]
IYNLKAGVKSTTQITSKIISVNGASRGLNVVNNNGYDLEINEFVTLNRGNNTINVIISNSAGATTKSLNVYVTEENPTPIWSDTRVALVIGNSDYATAPLQNPVNDATDLAEKLKQLGFDVTLLTNLSHSGFETALKNFKDKANNSDVALLFYAGHGMEINGKNYLIPTDAPIRDLDQLKYKSVDAYYALDILAGAKKKIVILDACRNNPATRDVMHGGLAAMNAKNAVIAYSTSPGMIALDGNGRNSPFSSALLKALDSKNLTLPQLFQKVGQFVNISNPDQTPWYVSSLMEDVILNR